MLLVKQRRCRTEQQTDAQGAGSGDTLGVLNSLVTAVPLPAVPGAAGQEVGRALVLHPLREPQQHPHVVVCGFGGVGGAGESGSWRWSLFLSLSSSPPFPFSLPSLSFIHLLYAFILRSVHSMLHFSFFSTSLFVHPFLSSFLYPPSSSFILHPSVLHLPPSPSTLPSSFILHLSLSSFALHPSSSSFILHSPSSFILHPSLSSFTLHPTPPHFQPSPPILPSLPLAGAPEKDPPPLCPLDTVTPSTPETFGSM